MLSLIEAADAGLALRRAFLRVAGRTIARHQLSLAIALGCERIICIAKSFDPQIASLQHEVEDSSRLFNVASEPRELSGLVTANDELVVIADGLLAETEDALKAMEGGPAVLVQPAETGVPAGFERLDVNHAAAGIMRVPGRLVAKLAELPADCDMASALTRIALQSGVATREVPAASRSGGRWQLIRNESDASAIEDAWLGRRLGDGRSLSPGRWLARLGVQILGPSLLHAGNSGKVMSLVTVATMAIGLGAAWLGAAATGFAFCALAWVFWRSALLIQRIENPPAAGAGDAPLTAQVLGWLLDLELVLLAFWSTSETAGGTPVERIFPPVMLVLLVRFVPQMRQSRWRGWLSDRMVLLLCLAGAALFGVVGGVVRLACLSLAIIGIAAITGNRD